MLPSCGHGGGTSTRIFDSKSATEFCRSVVFTAIPVGTLQGKKCIQSSKESRTLASLSDTLLPKLLSGALNAAD
jgi:hypothetical protein